METLTDNNSGGNNMLGEPYYGWSDFQLDGTSKYSLSYLDDIAFEWVEQAIFGLETLRPFCVKGFMEPRRFLCTVSYWNCYIVCESEDSCPLSENHIKYEASRTDMLQFCRNLYNDISLNVEGWALFTDYGESDEEKEKAKIEKLTKQLERLKELISKREECFESGRFFL